MFSEHFHVFIGDLSQDVESHQLREAFTPFGAISYVDISLSIYSRFVTDPLHTFFCITSTIASSLLLT